MAIEIIARSPKEVLDAILSAIDNGEIEMWEYEDDQCLTYSPPQWRYQAWFAPTIHRQTLRLAIVAPAGRPISVEAYAVYHGRLIEMLLAHFDDCITSIHASALPEHGDQVLGEDD
jgi:hypothetical protein